MKGTIVNFRSSRHRQYDNQMIIVVEGIDSKEKAGSLVGKKVVYKTESKKEINGKITFAHGNSGAVRAIFETGMPGQSLSKKIDIL
jgi:large subunit ribosomal protein L35Ae